MIYADMFSFHMIKLYRHCHQSLFPLQLVRDQQPPWLVLR